VFRGARVVDPAAGVDEVRDVLVDGDVVASGDSRGAAVVECDGLVLAPGLVDLHVHLREPGREDKETVESGSRAAAVGGFTAIAAMANTDPVADTLSVIQEVRHQAELAGLCDVQPVGAITRGLEGESLTEIGELTAAGVRMFSDDGKCVQRARLLRMALEYAKAFDAVVAEHCEEASLAEGGQMHEGYHSSVLGLAGVPSAAEEVIEEASTAVGDVDCLVNNVGVAYQASFDEVSDEQWDEKKAGRRCMVSRESPLGVGTRPAPAICSAVLWK